MNFSVGRVVLLVLATAGLVACLGDSPGKPADPKAKSGPPKPHSYGLQAWQTNPDFPEDYIDKYWGLGYDVTSLTHGNGVWAIVMSKSSGYTSQYWKTASTISGDFIEQQWKEGYDVTTLAYGGGLWAVVMSKGTGYETQSWRVSSTFPEKFIDTYWMKRYHITALDYGRGGWAVVMSKGSGYDSQYWKTSAKFPQDWIDARWNEGHNITSLTYGGGLWAVVMSSYTAMQRPPQPFLGVTMARAEKPTRGVQVTEVVADSPAAAAGIEEGDVIRALGGVRVARPEQLSERLKAFPPGKDVKLRLLRDGKEITRTARLGERTVRPGRGFAGEQWKTSSDFPQDFIDRQWGDGYQIRALTYGNGVWAVVCSKEGLPELMDLPPLPRAFFPTEEP
jgi:hypothetical protein